MIPIDNFLVLSSILFAIGMYGVLARRSALLIIMSVELMLQAVSINFVAFALYLYPEAFTGLVFVIFVIVIAAAEVGLALAIVLRLYRNRQTANVDEADMLTALIEEVRLAEAEIGGVTSSPLDSGSHSGAS